MQVPQNCQRWWAWIALTITCPDSRLPTQACRAQTLGTLRVSSATLDASWVKRCGPRWVTTRTDISSSMLVKMGDLTSCTKGEG